uniref:Transmembrane channel-like protein n=1 Tax=Fundulus heteroclitus TaxID=8078 RepID=A0A3Q2PPQ4_FUNHE
MGCARFAISSPTEEENLVKELVDLSTTEQIRKIRELPMSFEAKKYIRWDESYNKKVKANPFCWSHSDAFILPLFLNYTLNYTSTWTYIYMCLHSRQTLELWHGIMKEIGGKFGSGVLNYFVLLKWLLMFNIFSFLINFGFITIPLLVSDSSPNAPSNVSFKGLELLTGAGYFNYTIMYYGSYSNETLGQPDDLMKYNMQLAYFFTIAVYMVLCGIVLIFSMASSFKKNYALADPSSNSAWQLLCSWDFSMTNERAVNQRKNNLRVHELHKLRTVSEKLKHYGIHFGAWLLSTSLAVACGASIFYLYNETRSLLREAETLLVPFVVSLMNMVIPFFFSLFNKFEHYSNQRKQIYALLFRNVLLRMSILGVLCYYWMNMVPQRFTCWEPVVGQALYRLVIVDFLFLMLGSFFGEFLGNVIGTKLQPRLGVPDFFSQMKTIFIFLLFFPFFVGALSIVAYTTWSLTPSEHCGPFRGLNRTFSVVGEWIDELDNHNSTQWVVWTYQNVIRSELFYFLITLIFLVIIYIFWQLIQGRKKLIVLLKQQIFNVGLHCPPECVWLVLIFIYFFRLVYNPNILLGFFNNASFLNILFSY